jgi:CRP-like cAMP-binding protein
MVAGNMGINLNFAAGSQIFKAGDPATHLYLIQSGAIDIVIHDKVTETCGPNDAIGLLSMVDNGPQGMTARVRQDAVVTAIDQRKFRFMIDEVPHFSKYIMGLMARRIRELGKSV